MTADHAASAVDKLTQIARLARGEYRIQDGEIEMLQADCCAAVRDGLASVCAVKDQIQAHQSLKRDLGVTEKVFESVRSRISKKAGYELPEKLTESLTVWDCYDEANQQFRQIDAKTSSHTRRGGLR